MESPAKQKRCNCCPYGYHIDLDFVRYCESITNAQLMPDPLSNRPSRWSNMRRKRASREALLGLDTSKLALSPTKEVISTKTFTDATEGLQKAVMDFEKTFNDATLPRRHKSQINDWGQFNSLKANKWNGKDDSPSVFDSDLNKEGRVESVRHPIEEITWQNGSANNASAVTLQTIREQMATSLGRMRELEDQIKIIPTLKLDISRLKEDNAKLESIALKHSETIAENQRALLEKENVISNLNKIIAEKKQISEKKVVTQNASTATNDLYHCRTVGVGCAALTRELGVSTNIITVSTVGTNTEATAETLSARPSSPSEDAVSLNRIIGPPHLFKLKNAYTCTDLSLSHSLSERDLNTLKTVTSPPAKVTKIASTITDLSLDDIITKNELNNEVKSELLKLQTKNPKKNAQTITALKHDELYTHKEAQDMVARATKLFEKNAINNALSRKPFTANASIQTPPAAGKKTASAQATTSTMEFGMCASPKMINVSNQASTVTKDASTTARLEEKRHLSRETMTEPLKLRITETPLPKKVQFTTISTSTNDLMKVANTGMNTIKKETVNVSSETDSYSCKTCSKNQESNKVSPMPPASPAKRPSNLPILINRTHSLPRAQRRSKPLRNEGSNSDSGSEDGTYPISHDSAVASKIDAYYSQPANPKGTNYVKAEPSKEMRGAMKVLNDSLMQSPVGDMPKHMKTAVNIVQQEWFKISSVAKANPLDVEDYLDCFEEISTTLLEYIVNMTDVTGNTAMHYAVSNGNFDVVSILLDSKVCNINRLNTAGYTCIMLVALTKVESETDREVVRRLFQMADVNIRAKEHGQTALMLAVSHGRIDTVELLLEAGADINIQDEDGSTALMCAAEHGYIEIVKLLLAQPDCDLSITDYDGSTALAIAMEAGNRDIGVLLYAQEHFSRGNSPFPTLKSKRAKSTTPTFKASRPSTPSIPTSKKESDSLEH